MENLKISKILINLCREAIQWWVSDLDLAGILVTVANFLTENNHRLLICSI